MNIKKITFDYYSKFCCHNVNELYNKLTFIETDERNNILHGFGCAFTIYVFRINNGVIITYAPKYHKQMEDIKYKYFKYQSESYKINKTTCNEIIDSLLDKFPKLIIRKLFVYVRNKKIDTENAIKLTKDNYLDYEKFFLTLYPNVDINDGWLKEYYYEKAGKGYMFGYFEDNLLITVSDAPDVPYMSNIIQHTGIATLKEYRKKGYAKKVSYLAAQELIKIGICPQWETEDSNSASINLAKSIGYKEIAEAYILEE